MAEPVSEERQRAYFEKARKGVLTWLAGREGAAATLAELHDHSAERFLIAHQGFSKMMEGFVDEGLVDYDQATRTATLSDAGRRFIAA
jgi:predicted NAD/FAD-dependent oxidoreductase